MSEADPGRCRGLRKVTLYTRDGMVITQYLKASEFEPPENNAHMIYVGNAVLPRENFRCLTSEPSSLPVDNRPLIHVEDHILSA